MTTSGYFPWPNSNDSSTLSSTLASAREFYLNNGYVVFTSFATHSETYLLRQSANEILSSFYSTYNPSSPASIFTTDDSKRKSSDAYFLSSSGKISCFLEDQSESESTQKDKPAVNKIGHALHDLHPVFEKFSYQEKVKQAVSIARSGRESTSPVMTQSMYILKGAHVGGEVRTHRDATFVRGKDDKSDSCIGLWWALEDATELNGCLQAVPGSHKDGRVLRKLNCDENGNQSMIGENDCQGYELNQFVKVPMKEGDLIMLHGGLVHRSDANKSEKDRHAYSIHVLEGGAHELCWLKRNVDFPFRTL